jgi:purine-binding chemotaxis protein CheW
MHDNKGSTTGGSKLIQLVSFDLGTEEFGIDILKVQEINRMVSITRIPQAPHYVEGVINLRGKVIPVIDLRTKFGLESKDRDKNSRIVVCDVDGSIVGMVVDGVSEVLRVAASTVEPAPEITQGTGQRYVKGVVRLDDRLLLLLDISRLAAEAKVAGMEDELEELTMVPEDATMGC